MSNSPHCRLCHFVLPSATHESIFSLVVLPWRVLPSSRFFLPDSWEIISQYNFNLHFSYYEWNWALLKATCMSFFLWTVCSYLLLSASFLVHILKIIRFYLQHQSSQKTITSHLIWSKKILRTSERIGTAQLK